MASVTTAKKLAAVIAAVFVLAGCSEDRDTAADSVTLAHIHGLGVNPADGQLYVASHQGVFRINDGRPEQVAGRTQDFMGFTVIGPNHFLGSGHPGPGDRDQPPHLGLIESNDAAQTWQVVSLSGQADFHAIEAKRGRVYGYDSVSGQLLVSTDMRSWDRRASGRFIDLAMSPDDPDEVLATADRGLVLSTDGGRTFAPISAAPSLVFVDWPRAALVVGVAPDGTVYTSGDGGAQWMSTGQVPGRPQAIGANTVADNTEIYIATGDVIYRSVDSAKTFEPLVNLQAHQ
jgi:photosystem II stability/assembly factor-like uncharacterized protein